MHVALVSHRVKPDFSSLALTGQDSMSSYGYGQGSEMISD